MTPASATSDSDMLNDIDAGSELGAPMEYWLPSMTEPSSRMRTPREPVALVANTATVGMSTKYVVTPAGWSEGEMMSVPDDHHPPMSISSLFQVTSVHVLSGIETWWRGPGQSASFDAKANVYYGNVTVHDYLERTTWHSGQHVRQMMMVLGMLGIAPDRPIGKETFDGLPMPDKVWDDEKPAA